MSELRDNNDVAVTIGGEMYSLRFSMATVDSALDRFDDLSTLIAALTGGGESSQKEALGIISWLARLMVNEDIERRGADKPVFSERGFSLAVSPAEFPKIRDAALAAIGRGLPKAPEAEDAPKNPPATQ